MLTVTNLIGQTEAISKYNRFELNEELNGALTLSFTSFFHGENPGHELIEQESVIEYDGYTFRVKQLRTNSVSKNVSAISTYFDNTDKRKYDVYGGTHTLDEFLAYVLNGSGWTFINEDVTQSAFIPDFGNDNVVKLIDILRAAFECEMKIEPNNILRFANQLGADNDAQYRYGHNIRALSENTDTTNLKTYIEGFGAEGLHVAYTSPNESVFGRRDAEPFYDDRFSIAESLLEAMKKELVDYPETSIELDAIELQEKVIGERVWLIHEKLGIEYQTRVIAKRTRIPETLSSVVLGNRLPQRLSDILTSQKVTIDNNRKETRSKFEQTNEQILLSVERIGEAEATLLIQAGLISTKVEEDGVISAINQTAETISIEATRINLLGITNIASQAWIGLPGGIEEKTLAFRDSGVIWSPAGQNILNIENLGTNTYLYNNVVFGDQYGALCNVDFTQANVTGLNVPYAASSGSASYLGGYASSDFAKNQLGSQDITLEISGSGQLIARVNGKTATFNADAWTG